MICFPNSKINLGLNIIEKRSDGYHTIETVFYPVNWCDVLEVVEDGSQRSEVRGQKTEDRRQKAEDRSQKTEGRGQRSEDRRQRSEDRDQKTEDRRQKTEDRRQKAEDRKQKKEEELKFSASGLNVEGEIKNNLCVKAYQLIKKDFKIPSIKMHLHKIIPMGAGLGGGSSDAAFTLKLLNELFHLKLNNDTLKNYAKQAGSDCAFFIDAVPAFASGKGDDLEKINLKLKGLFLLIVKPDIHISTSDAYRMIKPQQPKRSLKELIQLPQIEWKKNLKNDFEKCVFEKFPLLADLKNNMYQQGAIYSSMSGSGSAVYGIFDRKNFDKNIFKKFLTWEGILN